MKGTHDARGTHDTYVLLKKTAPVFLLLFIALAAEALFFGFAPELWRSPAAVSAADRIAPRITGVALSNVGTSSAVVSWETDEPANALVEYGLSISFGFESAFSEALTTAHAVTLSDLTPGISYYYRVRAKDAARNRSTSDEYRLRTLDREADPNNSVLTVARVLAGQYDNAKYTVSVYDPDGLDTIYVETADNLIVWNVRPRYGLYGGIRSCPKEPVTTDALTFSTAHFPLTGYIVDCAHTGVKYPIEAAMPPGDPLF